MEFDDLLKLIDKVASTDLTNFTLDNGEVKIAIKRKSKQVAMVPEHLIPIQPTVQQSPSVAAEIPAEESLPMGNVIHAPLVGTFYHSSSPENPPYVKVGDTVKKGQVLGIIEAMKLMNEIESEFDGVVEAVLAENEQMVEYGQPLFVIK